MRSDFDLGQSLAKGGHRKAQRHRLDGRLHESPRKVEAARIFGNRVDQQRRETRMFSSMGRAQHRIAQQRRTNALLLMALGNGQASEHHHRQRVRAIALQAFRSILPAESAGSQAVIADDTGILSSRLGSLLLNVSRR